MHLITVTLYAVTGDLEQVRHFIQFYFIFTKIIGNILKRPRNVVTFNSFVIIYKLLFFTVVIIVNFTTRIST